MEFVLHFFRSSTVKVITLSKATKASSVVLFLFVSVCICFSLSLFLSLCASLFPFLPASPHCLPSPFISRFLSPPPSLSTSLPLSLCLPASSLSLSLSFFLSLSRHFSVSRCLSLAARRPPCCSRSDVNGPARHPRGLRRIGERPPGTKQPTRATRPTWREGSKTPGPTRPKSDAKPNRISKTTAAKYQNTSLMLRDSREASMRAAGRKTASRMEKLTAPQGLPGRSPTPVLTGPCAA